MTVLLYLQRVPEDHRLMASNFMEPTLCKNTLPCWSPPFMAWDGRAVWKGKGIPEPDTTMTKQQLTPNTATSCHLAGNPAS